MARQLGYPQEKNCPIIPNGGSYVAYTEYAFGYEERPDHVYYKKVQGTPKALTADTHNEIGKALPIYFSVRIHQRQ